jgi:hypothetical protein
MDRSEPTPSNPSEIEWSVDNETLDALSRLVGQPLRQALCSSLRAHVTTNGLRLRSEKIAIPVSSGLVTIAFPDWADTEHFALNAFRLEARFRETAPEWIHDRYSKKKGGPVWPWTGMEFSAPAFSSPPSTVPVKQVTIYRYRHEERHSERNFTEHVCFDKAVLLEREDDPSLLLHVDDTSIAGLLGISVDADEIAEVLEACTARTVIGEEERPSDNDLPA